MSGSGDAVMCAGGYAKAIAAPIMAAQNMVQNEIIPAITPALVSEKRAAGIAGAYAARGGVEVSCRRGRAARAIFLSQTGHIYALILNDLPPMRFPVASIS